MEERRKKKGLAHSLLSIHVTTISVAYIEYVHILLATITTLYVRIAVLHFC